MKILAIESSCDETAAAVVEDGVKILSNVIASSTTMHAKYGGIVPEVAAREQLKVIIPTIDEALKQANIKLDDIDALAVTVGPGLIGSLLVGVETVKTLSMATGKPVIPVNHVLAHMYANFIQMTEQNVSRALQRDHSQSASLEKDPSTHSINSLGRNDVFPAISLVVSGGHTELFLMTSHKDLKWLGGTIDDAAGEAFDKSARLLGFGNLGGPAVAGAAAKYANSQSTNMQIKLPRPLMYDKKLDFSFSGLKTAIMREWNKREDKSEPVVNAFAWEVQEAITDVLTAKTMRAAEEHNAKTILISGGVAANLRLREKLVSETQKRGIAFSVPPVPLCTDNAVYIASYAFFRGTPTDWHDITAVPDLSVETI